MRAASWAVQEGPSGDNASPTVDELFLGTVPLWRFEVASLGVLGHWEGTGCLSRIDKVFVPSLFFPDLTPVCQAHFSCSREVIIAKHLWHLLAKCEVATVRKTRKPPQSSLVIKPLNWQVLLFHCRACFCPMEFPLQALIREALV